MSACLAAAILCVACSRNDAKKEAPGKDSTRATMADMPGMTKGPDTARAPAEAQKSESAIPTTLTLTAAQVAHGAIKWEPVTIGTAAATATMPGQLTADEDRTVRLGAAGRGRVVSISVNLGDRVRRGQALVVLQSPDASAAQSDFAKATAALSSRRAQALYAKAAKDRAERLLVLKAIPRQDYDRAIADDELAQSEVHQAEAELRRARTLASQLGADTSSNGSIVLRSPQDGVVLSRSAVPGAVVDAGAPLVVVTDPSSLWLVINAPEPFAALFRTGGQLRFVVPAYPDSFSARITALGAGLEQDTRTLQVRGAVDSRGAKLKPGMLATVAVAGAKQMPAVLLPDDAVQLVQGRPSVFIAAADANGGARITRREVEIGSRLNGRVAVIRGLSAGDVVVTSGAFSVNSEFLKGGMPKMEM